MARIIYSALVTQIKGSVGGTTFQSNAYGFTIKNKASVVKPRTMLQERSKKFFASATGAWRKLSQTNRDTWVSWAAAMWPVARTCR